MAINEEGFSKEVEKELLKDTGIRPTASFPKAVVPAPTDLDPHRTTKQMMEQFQKIKEGLKGELEKEAEEHRRILERMDDIELAIRVIASAQAMLDVGE